MGFSSMKRMKLKNFYDWRKTEVYNFLFDVLFYVLFVFFL